MRPRNSASSSKSPLFSSHTRSTEHSNLHLTLEFQIRTRVRGASKVAREPFQTRAADNSLRRLALSRPCCRSLFKRAPLSLVVFIKACFVPVQTRVNLMGARSIIARRKMKLSGVIVCQRKQPSRLFYLGSNFTSRNLFICFTRHFLNSRFTSATNQTCRIATIRAFNSPR